MGLFCRVQATFFFVAFLFSDAAKSQPNEDFPAEIATLYGGSVISVRCEAFRYDETVDKYAGTGFIVSPAGYALTNNHVLPEASWYKSFNCKALDDGASNSYSLSIVDRDRNNDIALIRLSSASALPYAPISSDLSHVKRGIFVVSLGYPLGGEFSDYYSTSPGYLNSLKNISNGWATDAPINPGGSGSPVFDRSKTVVAIARGGIRKLSSTSLPTEYVEGINLLIPISSAQTEILKPIASLLSPVESQLRLFSLRDSASSSNKTVTKTFEVPENQIIVDVEPEFSVRNGNVRSIAVSEDKKSVQLTYFLGAGFPTISGVMLGGGEIRGQLKTHVDFLRPKTLRRSVHVREVKDNHPNLFTSHTSDLYKITVSADPGYRIEKAFFDESSSTRTSDKTVSLSNDGESAVLAFRLTSGPFFDRYRGWLEGDLHIQQIIKEDN